MSDRGADVLLYALLLVLPLAALVARRPPLKRTLLLAAAWVGIFLVGLAIAGQRDRFSMLHRNDPAIGSEVRIPMAADGHFWAEVSIDGVRRRMLIDSGATTTAVSVATARAAGLEDDSPFPVVLDTANGRITARTATAARIVIGDLVVPDVHVVVAPSFGSTDVIGMNVLSRLASWRVEGRTLVLTPAAASS